MFSAIKLIIFVIARNDRIGDFFNFYCRCKKWTNKAVKCNLFAVVEWKIGFGANKLNIL